ncbi:MAG TPA: hypothetical protein PKW95_12125 [bacterium]|nr:hypothetical protein [bacterium]
MKRTAGALAIEALGKLLAHGCLLLFWAPLLGWDAWFFAVLGVTVWDAGGPWRRIPAGAQRTVAIVYAVLVGLPLLLSNALPLFYAPAWWLGIALLTAAFAALLWRGLPPMAGMLAAATIAGAVVLPTLGRDVSLWVMAMVGALGVTIVLAMTFSPVVKRVSSWLLVGLFLFAPTFAANDWFYHGVDRIEHTTYEHAGLRTLMSLREDGPGWRQRLGTDLRFAERGFDGRLLIGAGRGVTEVATMHVRALPLGPAGDNITVDAANQRVIAATRDGFLSLLNGGDLGVVTRVKLPHGALVTRLAPEGVYALDEWNHVGLYEPSTLGELKSWRVTGVSDLLPDGEGGFFLSTLWGGVRRYAADGQIVRGHAQRTGIFHLLAYDRAGGRLFVGNMAGRRIDVLRANDLQRTRTIAVGRGIRNLLWDEQTNLLTVGDYFSGALIALDGETLHEVGRIALGRRLRTIAADGPGRVLAASSAGYFAVDLAAAFREISENN